MGEIFFSIDLPAMVIAALAGYCCSLIGAILLFQKKSMMADTLTHSILPGLALAYIFAGTMGAPGLLLGALITCLAAAYLVYSIQRYTVLDSNIAMGIVLTSMFSLGIVLIELFIDGRVHLDTQHALYGALELTYWPTPYEFSSVPNSITSLSLLAFIMTVLFLYAYKYLKLILFDNQFSRTIGLPIAFCNTTLLVVTVIVCVACFDAVGAILVLSLLICPPASARLLTDNFSHYIAYSLAFGIISGILGYLIGAVLPISLGFDNSVSAAGSIALVSGSILGLCILFAPQYGYFMKMRLK